MKTLSTSPKVLLTAIAIVAIFSVPSFASNHDITNNEKTVYEMPDTGRVLPNNPLFIFKQIREEIELLLATGEEKARLLVQLSDRYTSYGAKMVKLNKPQVAFQSFEESISYQNEFVKLIAENQKQEDLKTDEEICFRSIQSNIKQAEILRASITDISDSDQPAIASLLEKNLDTRAKIEKCGK